MANKREYTLEGSSLRYLMGKHRVLASNGVLISVREFNEFSKKGTLVDELIRRGLEQSDLYDYEETKRTGIITRIRQEPEEPLPDDDAPKKRGSSRVKKVLLAALDSFGLLVATAVSLVTITAGMFNLGVGFFDRFALIAIGWVIVLFGMRSWDRARNLKKAGTRLRERWYYILLWAMCASISFFFNTSTFLSLTDAQSTGVSQARELDLAALQREALASDPVLETLATDLSQAQAYLRDDILPRYDDAFRGSTVDSFLASKTAQEQKIAAIEVDIRERRAQVIQSAVEQARRIEDRAGTVVSSDSVFNAIGKAALDGRWIALLIFIIMFAGLEIIIIVSINEDEKPQEVRGE